VQEGRAEEATGNARPDGLSEIPAYHQGIIKNEIPLSVGGGIGHERTMMLLLRKTHLGGVTVSVWLKV
jgi:asparagine synthetase A